MAVCEGLKHIAKNLVESQTTVMLGVPLVFEGTHKKIFKQAASSGKDKSLKKGIALSKKLKLYNRGNITHKIFKDVHKATGGHIDLFIAGGAAMNAKVLEDFQAIGFPMIQGYGMTENTPIIAVTQWPLLGTSFSGWARARPRTIQCSWLPSQVVSLR